MEKKQTAVEWLIKSLPQIDWEHPHYGQLVQQAKEMEKEQMFHFTMEYIDENLIHFGKIRFADTPEDYYNEFYNKEE